MEHKKSRILLLGIVAVLALTFVGLRRYAANILTLSPPSADSPPAATAQPLAESTNTTELHERPQQLAGIELPDGFAIDYFAENVPGARSMTLGKDGQVFVGTRSNGVVYAVEDTDQNGVANTVTTIARNLNSPNGVAYKDNTLYIVEIDTVRTLSLRDTPIAQNMPTTVLFDGYPDDTHHGWKYAAFGPDGLLYIPVGAPCNVCDEPTPYSSITRIDPSNSEAGYEVVAQGIRNTVGFDWHPETGQLWFTENGRDLLGDNTPPDELNRISDLGQHFGFPYCHGLSVIDPGFASDKACSEYTPPELELGPHVAALGLHFYTGSNFPAEYTKKAFIAEHGSWNRSEKIGYRITTADITNDFASNYSVFAQGWLDGEDGWGRPVDVIEYIDGSLLVSDDAHGAIYRIWYVGE